MTLRKVMVGVGLLAATAAAAAAPARATYGARVTADEPQYLLTAISLAEDQSLDISDELRQERWRPFHEALLPQQTEVQRDGSELSPHDPLLPVVLAVPIALGGWLAAKLTLAVIAGLLAALLVWVAVRRFGVPLKTAAVVVGAFAVTAPLTAYGAQIYPELPAALAVTVAVAAVAAPRRSAAVATAVAAVVVLPWLSVKYAPVAGAIALYLLVVIGGRRAIGVGAVLVAAAAGYFAFHHAVYGGWTVYAAGDHFAAGELTVAGTDPDLGARSTRLVGLLVDRDYGLASWAPAYLLAIPALAALARRRPAGWLALVLPLGAGWVVATFVAFTMHGVWWPGRQVVVVLPAAVLVVAWWLGQLHPPSRWRLAFVASSVAGAVTWVWLLAGVLTLDRRLVVDVDRAAGPLHAAWRLVLPDYRHLSGRMWTLHALWLVAVAVLTFAGWRSLRPLDRRSNDQEDQPLAPDPLPLALAVGCGSDDGAGTGSGSASGSGSGSGSGSASSCQEPGDQGTVVDVTLRDFAIDVDGTPEAGTVVFEATNEGPEDHEIVVAKGVAPDDLPYDDAGVVDEDELPDGALLGEIEAFPAGETCAGSFELEAGDYTLFCNVVTEDGESHANLGMVTPLTVE